MVRTRELLANGQGERRSCLSSSRTSHSYDGGQSEEEGRRARGEDERERATVQQHAKNRGRNSGSCCILRNV